MAIEITKDNYKEAVASSAEKPVVMDFWGPKCTHCMALMPSVDALEAKYAEKFSLGKVNVAGVGNRRVAMAFKVMSLPTLLFFKDGVETARLTGTAATPESVEEKLKELLA